MNTKFFASGTKALIAATGTSLAGLMLLNGCHREPGASRSVAVLAEVNGEAITEAAFRYQWQQRHTGPDTSEAREAMLDRLIERSTLVQQARGAGLDSDPVVMEQVENLLVRRLEELQLQPRLAAVEVVPEEVETYYHQNLETRYTQLEQRRLAVLWFNTRGQAPLAARYRPRLEQARAEVINQPDSHPAGQGFGSLAIRNSEHRSSQYKGGDLGWMGDSDVPGFRSEVMKIGRMLSQPGEVSPVVETAEGLFVVRLIDSRPATTVDLASVEPEIRRKLQQKKQQQVESEFRAQIRQSATITRYPEHLSALSALASAPALASERVVGPGAFETPEAEASSRTY